MARTIRRKGVKSKNHFDTVEEHDAHWDHYFGVRYNWRMGYRDDDMRKRRSLSWKFHTDGYQWLGIARRYAREDTNEQRRAYDKKLRYELKKDADYDYYDRQKLYNGLIWMYD